MQDTTINIVDETTNPVIAGALRRSTREERVEFFHGCLRFGINRLIAIATGVYPGGGEISQIEAGDFQRSIAVYRRTVMSGVEWTKCDMVKVGALLDEAISIASEIHAERNGTPDPEKRKALYTAFEGPWAKIRDEALSTLE